MKKPTKLSKRAEIARIKKSLWAGDHITARELRDGLQQLLNDDPGNLDAEFMFGLCRGCPQHAHIICHFTNPNMRKLFAKSGYVQKQPQLRKAFIEDRVGQAKPADGDDEPKPKRKQLFRK